MTHYVHGQTTRRPATEADLAAARHHNAQLAAELRQLEAIGERLQASVAETKARLEAERDAALDALNKLRAETTRYTDDAQAMIRYRARMAELPEPVYGGRAGLLAATAEIEAHARPNGRPGPSHGTRDRYYETNCRCTECQDWYDAYKIRTRDRYRKHHSVAARQQAAA